MVKRFFTQFSHGEYSRGVSRHAPEALQEDEGAGDQGIMFGYACRETEALMPAPISFSHEILRSLAEARHSGAEPGLEPDAKSQVTLVYEAGKPVRAASVVVLAICSICASSPLPTW